MMIARWQFQARFGRKQDAIDLSKEWDEQIGAQTDLDVKSRRITTGSVGAKEALVEVEYAINGLGDLQEFFDKIATIQMHKDWGRKMGEVIVSGSTFWQVLRVVE